MLTVIRKNKEMKILETQKAEYLVMGYSVIDETGKIIESGNALTTADLKSLVDTVKVENEKLKLENKKLKNEIKKLKAEKDGV